MKVAELVEKVMTADKLTRHALLSGPPCPYQALCCHSCASATVHAQPVAG